MAARFMVGDCRQELGRLLAASVHTVVTSPPYYGLRHYQVPPTIWGGSPGCDHVFEVERIEREILGLADVSAKRFRGGGKKAGAVPWVRAERGFCRHCGAWKGQLGLEPTPELYVAHLVEAFRAVHRVLRPDGTLWINIGDSYAGSGKGGNPVEASSTLKGGPWQHAAAVKRARWGKDVAESSKDAAVTEFGRRTVLRETALLKDKDLIGIPWLLAFALRADGWYLRQEIIWHKKNCTPESVQDRCTKAHEHVFLFSKSERYYYDAEAIEEEGAASSVPRLRQASFDEQRGGVKDYGLTGINGNRSARKIVRNLALKLRSQGDAAPVLYRNKRSVWEVPTQPFPGAHFAVMPPGLVEPCILAGCPEGGVALDPFAGAGTVGVVAERLGRNSILVDLSEDYAKMGWERIEADRGAEQWKVSAAQRKPSARLNRRGTRRPSMR